MRLGWISFALGFLLFLFGGPFIIILFSPLTGAPGLESGLIHSLTKVMLSPKFFTICRVCLSLATLAVLLGITDIRLKNRPRTPSCAGMFCALIDGAVRHGFLFGLPGLGG